MHKNATFVLFAFGFLLCLGIEVFAQDTTCIENPDPLSNERPLLNQFRAIYTDAVLQKWNWSNYDAAYNSFKPINGVKLTKIYNPTGQFVDRRVGGVTQTNLSKAISYARSNALLQVPTGAELMPELEPYKKHISWGKNNSGVPVGVMWAWNSLMYVFEGDVYEIVYFYHGFYIHEACGAPHCDGDMTLVANKSARICKSLLPPPVADPTGTPFDFTLNVTLSNMVPGAEIYFRQGTTGVYEKYTGSPITLTDDTVLEAFATKETWLNSDTISEVYSKTNTTSILQVSKYTGEPLGGSSYLTEEEDTFVIKLTVPYAGLESVNIDVTSATGLDTETVVLTNPQIQNNALIFTDTVSFAVLVATIGNAVVEASNYDNVVVSFTNPKNTSDTPTASFSVKPAPQVAKIYFADENWNELTQSLLGSEPIVYVVVEDAVFDPARLEDYVVTLVNKKGAGNDSPADKETYRLTEIVPGKYSVTIEVVQSPPVDLEDGNFQIRIGDELKVNYVNPINPVEKSDIIGYGVPTQLSGQVVFTNEDQSVPPAVMAGNLWDAEKGKLFIKYTDDYVASLTTKQARITIVNTDGQGNQSRDEEPVNMVYAGKEGALGIWVATVLLDDNHTTAPGDGKLQYYFRGDVTVEVATHMTGTSERLEGDTTKATINIARANVEEVLEMTDPQTGGDLGRNSTSVKVCVEDQVFSSTGIDTLLLDKIECKLSGDKIENVVLVQSSVSSTEYCGIVQKAEAQSGTLNDHILHCQDIDNVVSRYVDPIYGTEATQYVTIMDQTLSKIEFFDIMGNAITRFSDVSGDQIRVRLTHKSPDMYVSDTLKVKLKSSTGDTLDVLVFETEINSGVFENVVNIAFTAEPNMRNNILEGKLNPASLTNQMTVTGTKGVAKAKVDIYSGYIPVERAWIVDGNKDGQGDSIYIQFRDYISMPPTSVSSIDWEFEGAQCYIATYNSYASLSEINYVAEDLSLIAILLPGVLDDDLVMFPSGKTNLELSNPPYLTLPNDKFFQGQEVPLEDGMGAVVMDVEKFPSDNTYYKDAEGYLQKQPDTLVITLSEKIRQVHTAGTPWDSLFMFMSPQMIKTEAYPLISMSGLQPKVQGPDSLEWTFIVDNGINTMKPLIHDELFLNPNAPYVDASKAKNKPEDAECIITGAENPKPINNSNIFVPVIGSSVNDPRSLVANLYIDEEGRIAPGRDVLLVQTGDGGYEYERMWIKPRNLQFDGTVSAPDGKCIQGTAESEGQTEYPDNCLSTVQIFSTDAYIAEVAIFDHMGKFVHQSVQYFGQCGELENPYRRTSRGLASWLVWNQKDMQGTLVGTGVYIWKVKFSTSAGAHTTVYRQGIVRAGVNPLGSCVE
ncbi:MAG: hypothetical protein HQK83_11610 [Fibrobacteria bacterium]|nr:hypothetical protein [Fibrobacteria bacterium]